MTLLAKATTILKILDDGTNMTVKVEGTDSVENTASNVFTFPDTVDNLDIEGDTVSLAATEGSTVMTTAHANVDTESEFYASVGAFMNLNFGGAILKGTEVAVYRVFGRVSDSLWANLDDDQSIDNGCVHHADGEVIDWETLAAWNSVDWLGMASGRGFYVIIWYPNALDTYVGAPYDGTPESLKYRYDSGCLQVSYDGGTSWYDVACSLATLQDALDVLALIYPTEQYDAGEDADGFIRVTTGGSGAGTIDFSQTFQELLDSYVAEFWPPELWYEHVPKWV